MDQPVVEVEAALLDQYAKLEEASDPEEVCPSDTNEEEASDSEEVCPSDTNGELEESMSDMDMVLKHLGSFVRIWVILLIHTDALPGYNHTPARLVLLGVFAWVFGILTLVGLFIENNLFTSTVRRYFGFCSVALELAYIFAALFSVGLAIASDATIAGRIAVPILLFLDTLLAVVQIKMSLQYWAQHSELLVAFKSGSIVAWWKYPLLIRSWHMLSSFKVPFACKSSAPDFVVLVVLLFEVIVSRIGWFFNHEMDGVFNVATVFIAIQVALFALKWRLAKIYTDFLRFWVDIVYIVFITATTLVYTRGPRRGVMDGTICIMLLLPMPLLGCCHVDFFREASTQMRVAYASSAMFLLGLGLVVAKAPSPSFCDFDCGSCWGYMSSRALPDAILLVPPMPFLGCCLDYFLREASTQMRVAYASFAMSLLGLGLLLKGHVLAIDPSFCQDGTCWGYRYVPDPNPPRGHFSKYYFKDPNILSLLSILCYVGVGCAVVPS
eukprot:CAMPEP_0203794008 /NCGR_PEP_ID=MMETSP0100_2-20121128/6225_1 /ASSEMBLY_ACC=CAM_ASM_000210 /TAXON_ID=96639 /ORGANISM=" , Strain NY0313808BC1" /LENGTH=495 /DNA_ID=CAMNT_0050697937 /DNA_START=1646 /DNA_END=3130 /DNA_ORIENTATION=-